LKKVDTVKKGGCPLEKGASTNPFHDKNMWGNPTLPIREGKKGGQRDWSTNWETHRKI